MAFEVYQLEAVAAERVGSVDAAPFKQGSIVASFTESDQAISADGVSYATSHLSFSAFVTSSPAMATDNQGSWETAKVRSRLLVEFLYHLRPGQQIGDQRLALRAAAAVRRALARRRRRVSGESISESRLERWTGAKITGPSVGICSRPETRVRK